MRQPKSGKKGALTVGRGVAEPAADEAGRIGVGVVEAPEDDGRIVNGRVPPLFGVSARGLTVAGIGA